MTYDIRPEDEPLIRASLALGDWLLAQPELSRAQRNAVEALQAELRGLPAAGKRRDVVEYGFHVRWEPPDGRGLYRAWRVTMGPSGLEVFSVYSPDQPIDIEDKGDHELNLWIRPNRPNMHDGYYYAEWMDEVADPGRFRNSGGYFGVHAEVTSVE